MDRLEQFQALAADLKAITPETAKTRFTELFVRGFTLLELNDEAAARMFDTSRPNANRWRNGKVVPSAATLVLRFLREEVEAKVRVLRTRPATGGGYSQGFAPMAAKGSTYK